MFGVVPKSLWEKTNPADSDNMIDMSARCMLIEDGDNTILRYTAKAETGGKLAQLGGRLITSTAKKLSKMFFEKFEQVMSGEVELEEAS